MDEEARAALIAEIAAMSDRDVLRGMETAELESEEGDLFAAEAKSRNLDS